MNLCDSYAVFLSNEIFLNEPVTNGQGLLSLRNNFIAISQLSVKINNISKKKIRIKKKKNTNIYVFNLPVDTSIS